MGLFDFQMDLFGTPKADTQVAQESGISPNCSANGLVRSTTARF
jgi:hypothetical protein